MIFASVPFNCHSSNRHRHVGPDGYRPGRLDHGSPVVSIHKIAFATMRGSARGLPRRLRRVVGLSESMGARSSHSSLLSYQNTWFPPHSVARLHPLHNHGFVTSDPLDILSCTYARPSRQLEERRTWRLKTST